MKKFVWKVLTLMILVALFAVPARAADAIVPLKLDGIQNYDEIHEVLKYVNRYRAEVGADPVVLDAELTEFAMQRAAELAVDFSHTRPNGKSCYTVLDGSAFADYGCGENIAMGQNDGAEAADSWYHSPGHYANMIRSSHKTVGIGCFHQPNGEKTWVQLFSSGDVIKACKTTGKKNVTATVMAKSSLVDPDVFPLDQDGNLLVIKGKNQQVPLIVNYGTTAMVLGDCYRFVSEDTSIVKGNGRVLTGVSAGETTVDIVFDGLTLSVPVKVYDPLQLKYTVSNGTAVITWEDPTGIAHLFYKRTDETTWHQSAKTDGQHWQYIAEGEAYEAVLRIRCGKDYIDISNKLILTRDGMKEAAIVTQPKTGFAKLNGTVSTTVKAEGDGLTYTWYFKNEGAAGYSKSSITSATYSTTMSNTSRNRRVYCVVRDAYGNKVQTNTVYLRMAASIVTQPTNKTVASGKTAQVTVGAWGDGLTYKWYYKNAGATKFSLTTSFTSNTYSVVMNGDRDGRQIYCVVTDKYGYTAKSNVVTLKIAEPVSIKTQPKTVYAKLGAEAEVSVGAAGDGLTYQWYYKDAGATKFTLTTTFTGPTYLTKMTEARKDRQLYCVIKDAYGNKVQTKTVYLRMAATITAQPKGVTVAKGATAKVGLTAAGDGLTYTWYYKNAGDSKFLKTDSFKGKTYQVEMTEARSGRQIYCVVTDKYGYTAKSNVVTLKMTQPVSIKTQPKTVYAKLGAEAKVTVSAAGDGLTYQWYYKDAGSTKFTLTKTFTGPSYSAEMNEARKDRQLYCVIKDAYGNKVQTKTVYLRMAATVTTQPKGVTVAGGAVAKVTVGAVGDGLTYTWYYKNAGDSKFLKTDSFKGKTYQVEMTKARSGRQIYCVVTDKYGNTVKTDTVTLKMK